MTVLLVGEQPPERWAHDAAYRAKHDPMFPYPPRSAGSRLREISGLGLGEYIHGMERVNLIPDWITPWPAKRAVERARELIRTHQPSAIICCGRRVATAFGFAPDAELPCAIMSEVAQARVVAIPHPSGRNSAYSDPAIVERVRDEFQRVRPMLQDWQARRAIKREQGDG